MNYLLGFCLFMLSACGHTVNQDNVTYQVSPAQNTFVVTLASNPTTGYQWVVKKYDQSLLTLTSSQYTPPTNSKLMGAPGHMVFNFAIKTGIVRPQNTVIKFWYKRPWEPKAGTVKNVTINFQYTPRL